MSVREVIADVEAMLPGHVAPEDQQLDPRWQAIIRIEDFLQEEPEEVWPFIHRWGSHEDEDLRAAIATVLLEHLLEYHFVRFFPKVRSGAEENALFADTFNRCGKFGQSKEEANSRLFDRLQKEMRQKMRLKKIPGTAPKASRPHAPGYGFPKGQKGLLPWTWAEQRLKKSHNYWITTVKPDGSPHTMVVWGLWQDGCFVFSTGSKSRKARNLAGNSNCIVCTEHANEAVIVEGAADIADVAARRKMLPAYGKKYKFDMSSMEDDILSMKEPVFAVRPRVVFGLPEKQFQSKSTRWRFV